MLNRRSFLGRSAAVLVGAPLAAVGLTKAVEAASGHRSANPAAKPKLSAFDAASGLPVTIVNHTYRYANNQIYFYVVGTDLGSGKQAYMAADGTLTEVSLSDNGSNGYADLSVPLVADGDTSWTLPANMSGRIYFSINEKLLWKVVTDGNGNPALQYPAGWVSSDPNYNILHDFFEFTYNSGGMFCNVTMVDQFAIPLSTTLTGAATQTTGTLVDGGRDNIFNTIAANSAFAPLIVSDSGTNLRVIAPGHGIDSGVFSSTYLDSYIDQVWSQYASSTMTVNTGSATYTGQVSGGQFVFSGGVAPFSKPTTQNVFYCNGALNAPNDGVTGPVAAILGAGFNRGVLLNSSITQPDTNAGDFYQVSPTNSYSAAIHANTVDGKAYGFPFDDVGSFASYVQDGAPTSLRLEMTPFGTV